MPLKRNKVIGARMRSTAAVCALVAAGMMAYAPAPLYAQTADDLGFTNTPDPNAQLLLQADDLIYNNDTGTVVADRNVRIDYDGNLLVADRVTYVEATGRLIAQGNVELLQPDGTRTIADELDITDDFANGFVNGLRVITPDNARFAAESAERRDGSVTIFNNGIYTACEPCAERPEKPPIWQIKSQTIIWNGEEKTIRFENARFEFLGVPLAFVPVFTTADPTVRRKTGFLAPTFGFTEELGFSAEVPFFWNLAPNYDVTFRSTGFTRQGFLGEAEWRHRLENGRYNLKIAGIHQLEPDAFSASRIDSQEENRGMIGTQGQFQINPRWVFGWNGLLQSDKNFSRTYDIGGFNNLVQRNEIYLTGLEDRSYFDARVMNYDIQESTDNGSDERQSAVLPTVDYERTFGNVFGGDLSLTFNTRNNLRDDIDQRGSLGTDNFNTFGLDGFNGRTSVDVEWDRQLISSAGLVVKPIVAAQGDAFYFDSADPGDISATGATLTDEDSYFRGMVTAGVEMRWPFLVSAPGASHVIEPIAQVFVRPDETGAGMLPNEDAQSFVFDTSNLFDRDKFSGFDRVEGGTRANVGLRYTGTFDNGVVVDGVFGQSYHIAGVNSFAQPDFVNAGADSGLESDVSDFVASLGVQTASGFGASVGARFDERSFEVRRVDAGLSFENDVLEASIDYARQQAQPTYAFSELREEVTAGAAITFAEYWTVAGSATYDIATGTIDKRGIGLMYDDECFVFEIGYSQDRNSSDELTENYSLRFSLKTIGDFGAASKDLF